MSDEPAVKVTAGYFYHISSSVSRIQASNPAIQDALLAECARLSGVALGSQVTPEC